ncbi:MAG: HigA family addiction module antidote protein [Leptospiraceae bacterium]|nr:HigA family addiction module antidote protein [Leptospiraceae bacterium]MBK9499973.1 HigA family addiction module antidote protein [Leptospiraceae bacterium]MBL0263572.1 HigA family addiction module antidote protein [Leptospiraceae bacterium]
MKKLPNIHPGEILSEEFLIPMGISAYRLAKETKINPTRVSEIVNGKRGISVDTALRFYIPNVKSKFPRGLSMSSVWYRPNAFS